MTLCFHCLVIQTVMARTELEWWSIGDKEKKIEVCEYMDWMSPQRSISIVLGLAKGSFFIEHGSVY